MNMQITRRSAFGVIVGAGTGVTLLSEVPAFAGPTELEGLIEAHRLASDTWLEASLAEDCMDKRDPAYEATGRTVRDMQQGEKAALLALLSYRPTTLREVSDRLEYMRGPAGPWEACFPETWELEALFGSMMIGRA